MVYLPLITSLMFFRINLLVKRFPKIVSVSEINEFLDNQEQELKNENLILKQI